MGNILLFVIEVHVANNYHKQKVNNASIWTVHGCSVCESCDHMLIRHIFVNKPDVTFELALLTVLLVDVALENKKL